MLSKPNHYEYIRRLQQWRDKYERMLDLRPRIQPLALVSHYLTEFQYNKIDEIEIPGQYTEVRHLRFNLTRCTHQYTRTRTQTRTSPRFKSSLQNLSLVVPTEPAGRELPFMQTTIAKFHLLYNCPAIARLAVKIRSCKFSEPSMGMIFDFASEPFSNDLLQCFTTEEGNSET